MPRLTAQTELANFAHRLQQVVVEWIGPILEEASVDSNRLVKCIECHSNRELNCTAVLWLSVISRFGCCLATLSTRDFHRVAGLQQGWTENGQILYYSALH